MREVTAGYQILEQPDILKKIERVAKVCYKSENTIQEGSAARMVSKLIQNKHYAMLEHANIIFEVDKWTYTVLRSQISCMIQEIPNNMWNRNIINKSYLRFTNLFGRNIVSGNVRAWYELFESFFSHGKDELPIIPKKVLGEFLKQIDGIEDDSFKEKMDKYNTLLTTSAPNYKNYDNSRLSMVIPLKPAELMPQERMVHELLSVLFTVDRGVTHELVRMRDCSFAQESTRYCNYSKDKFDREITFVTPCFYLDSNGDIDIYNSSYLTWKSAMKDAEDHYFELINNGAKPQEARNVLPTSVKSDIVVTANLQEWQHIFDLRACDSTGPAHPQMKEVMVPLFKKMRNDYDFAFGDMKLKEEQI